MQQGQLWSKVTLCWVHGEASVFRGGEGEEQSHRQLDAIWSQIHKPFQKRYNTFRIEIDKSCAF